MLPVVGDRLAARDDLAELVPMPSSTRPWVRWSMVMAVMARVTGGRADSWETAVPSLIRAVREPHQASGVHASLP